MNTRNRHKVAVYGTLRPRDEDGNITPATHQILGYRMYNAGRFPYIVHTGNIMDRVLVNILDVDDHYLDYLDHYEGVGRGLYKRVTTHVWDIGVHDWVQGTAWVYEGDNIVPPLIESGDWADA